MPDQFSLSVYTVKYVGLNVDSVSREQSHRKGLDSGLLTVGSSAERLYRVRFSYVEINHCTECA